MLRFLTLAVLMMLGCASTAVQPANAQAANDLRVYEVPRELLYAAHNDDYTVRVRKPGGPWQSLYEYRIRVDADTLQNASLVYFDFAGKVEIEIEKNNGNFNTAQILPLRPRMRLLRGGSLIRLTLDRPERFSIQFDGDRLHNLHILAGAIPEGRPKGDDVIYFGPGLHVPPDGGNRFPVKSGDRIYLAPGAVLRGSFALDHVRDVRISGRGLLYNPGSPIDLDGASNIDIRELIVVNDEHTNAARVINIRNSENVSVREISGFTAGKWSDGINISTSQHVRIDGGYLRVSDDGVVVYAVTDCPICGNRPIPAGGPPGAAQPADTFDIKARNLTIWNDVAHSLFVGHFGDADAPRTVSNVTFEKIDIVNFDEDDPMWDGVMAIYSGNGTLIKNVTFSDINVHRIEEGRLINIVAGQTKLTIASAQANKVPGRGIEDVTLRNIAFAGDGMPNRSIISGLGAGTMVKGLRIENLRIGGRKVMSARAAGIDVGPWVSGFSIR
ncbi:hypothetical protein FHW96_004615 [Novosphingobium sp. SG751A]|uniref:glycosyl hydrolase family 28 protein n=1 Tax=Novosphingobium sp. SG751A TaxID=2587000 RepID=UPI00155576B3|nr:glycosyl hydrolase family 28 protein [Novosphingobium sp. SG751A]NOW48427.1 hypothetical protein [Novosphingobium sp. SG751A]